MKFFFAHVVGDVVATGRPANQCHERQLGRMAQGRAVSVSVQVSEGRA
ncbi:hypothetical protein ACEI36_14755 [Pseudomonas kielensis]